MAAAIGSASYALRAEQPPSRCAECQQVLVDALVLTCGHDLCLACAGVALRNTTSLQGRTVACGICRERTQLCEEAAATLAAQPVQAAVVDGAFNLMDRNNDGSHSRAEWHKALQGSRQFAAAPSWGSMIATRPTSSPFQAVTGLSVPRHQPDMAGGKDGPPSPLISRGLLGRAPSNSPDFDNASALRGPRDFFAGDSLPSRAAVQSQSTQQWHGRLAHIPRCPDHPEEQATYFCATCECFCICAECVVQRSGRHHDHDVMRVGHAHEKLRARAGVLLDEAVALEDEFAMVVDRLMWRRKDVERAAARGRASVRSAFERVRAQLNDREAELLESLEAYECENLTKLDAGYHEHTCRLEELRRLQENLRSRCRNGEDAVEALNAYATAKRAIASISNAFRGDDVVADAPEEFVGLAGSARFELDLHAEGLASLEEAVQRLCSSGARGEGGKTGMPAPRQRPPGGSPSTSPPGSGRGGFGEARAAKLGGDASVSEPVAMNGFGGHAGVGMQRHGSRPRTPPGTSQRRPVDVL